jgi:hypothetical protein
LCQRHRTCIGQVLARKERRKDFEKKTHPGERLYSRWQKMAFALLLVSCSIAAAAATSSMTSRKPPLGWSSWYALGEKVNQTAMEQTFRKLTNRSVVPGDNRSLLDVGYTFANMDDGYQACGAGVNGSFHDAEGYPILDPAKFANVTAMTSLARTLGLKPGFYVNNYICGSGECAGGVGGAQYERVMHSTVSWLKENGYHYLKVDSGGCYNDMTLWRTLLDAAEWPMTVENCHQGGQPPNATWCPFDLWRVGADVNGEFADVEILQVIAALSSGGPGARSGCRPYPDFMSLPGFKNSSTVRSNFGLYAIMGTPMVFSFDVRDDTKLLCVRVFNHGFCCARVSTIGLRLLYVRIFGQKFALEDVIGSHTCSLEASMRVTNDIPLGWRLFFTG